MLPRPPAQAGKDTAKPSSAMPWHAFFWMNGCPSLRNVRRSMGASGHESTVDGLVRLSKAKDVKFIPEPHRKVVFLCLVNRLPTRKVGVMVHLCMNSI